jgi:hypothetical protein
LDRVEWDLSPTGTKKEIPDSVSVYYISKENLGAFLMLVSKKPDDVFSKFLDA